MAREIRSYTVTVPPGTTAAAPYELDCSFPPRQVDAVEIIVPPGPNGVLGFHLANSGVIVIPYASDRWIIAADEKIIWPLDGQIDSGSWQVFAYNTGTLSHTFYVRFLLSLVQTGPGAGPVAPLDAVALSQPPSSAAADLTGGSSPIVALMG